MFSYSSPYIYVNIINVCIQLKFVKYLWIINYWCGFILVVFIPLILIICSNIKELIIMIKEKNDEK